MLSLELLRVFLLRPQAADGRKRHAIKVQRLARKAEDVLTRDGIVAREHLVRREHPAEVQLGIAELVHARGGGFLRHEHARVHLFARAVELRLRDAVGAEALQLVADEREGALLRLAADGGRDAEHAAVEKARRVGVDGVAQAVFLAHGLKQARGHVPAEDGREQRHGKTRLRPRRQTGKADADLILLSIGLIFTFGMAHHVLCGVPEWLYVKLGRTEEAREIITDLFKKTSVTMLVCYAGFLIFGISLFLAVFNSYTPLPKWACLFNTTLLMLVLTPLRIGGSGNWAGAIMFLGLLFLL